jgi:CrcB protein
MYYSIIAICIGASAGALTRWGITNSLNTLFPNLPPGTLLVNCVGGYLIGLAVMGFAQHPQGGAEWRLLVITGFLGSLTTFSTFSAEVIGLIHQQKVAWALLTVGAHTGGALLMTFMGIVSWQGLQQLLR